jgi:hypothetical protein
MRAGDASVALMKFAAFNTGDPERITAAHVAAAKQDFISGRIDVDQLEEKLDAVLRRPDCPF